MMPRSCAREKEVADLLQRGHYPQACSAELRSHVAECRACGRLVLLTQTFQQARAEAAAMARLDSPGVLWWRAQLRRRNAAIERISKPLLGAQVLAVAASLIACLVLVAGFLAVPTAHGSPWLSRIEEAPRSLHLGSLWPSTFPPLAGDLWLVVPILAVMAVLGGVVAYVASEER